MEYGNGIQKHLRVFIHSYTEFSTVLPAPPTMNTHCMWQIGLAWDSKGKGLEK